MKDRIFIKEGDGKVNYDGYYLDEYEEYLENTKDNEISRFR